MSFVISFLYFVSSSCLSLLMYVFFLSVRYLFRYLFRVVFLSVVRSLFL